MQQFPLSAVANAQGVATATVPSRAINQRWNIQQISVQTNSANTTAAGVYLNSNLFAATKSGNFDAATGAPSLPISGKDNLQIQWSGCNNGDVCTAVLFFDYMDS